METRINQPAARTGNRGALNLLPSTPTTAISKSIRRFSGECSQKLTDLKDRVADQLAGEFRSLSPRFVRQVVNEADSLAATTAFPALLFPALAEERVRNASDWAARQQLIRDQTRPLVLALAA